MGITTGDAAPFEGIIPGTLQANHAVVVDALKAVDQVHTAALYIGSGAGTLVTATAAQLNATNVDGVVVYRKNVSVANVHAGATAIVPAVSGKRFQVLQNGIQMRANGGTVSGATTVGVKEDGGAVFLSQAVAGLTDTTWQNCVTGTPVITGMTSGGMTAVANKALLAYDAGGTSGTATSIDFIVCGYYTTA